MKAIVGGRFIMPNRLVLEREALLFDEIIQGFVPAKEIPKGCEIIDAKGMYVAPGLVDVHIHGYMGEDASDGSEEGVQKIAQEIIKNGVTSFCPTTMTIEREALQNVFHSMRRLRERSREETFWGAEILGVHAEGPFINPAKKGAQNGAYILAPDASWIQPYADIIRMITIAPEMEGAMHFIDTLTEETSVVVSAGHTDADYETVTEAVWHGLSHITHTFNAMTGLNHRAPGAVGAALTAPVSAELIADCFHVHPALFQLMARAKGDKLLVLVTDCTRAGGLSDGVYDLGGQEIYVNGIECRLSDGTIAGSVLKLNHAVSNMRAHTDLPIWEVVNMASRNPARVLREERKGSLEKGKDADIIFCDESFAVHRTISRGRTVYESP